MQETRLLREVVCRRQAIRPLLDSRSDDKLIFKQLALERWIQKQKIQLTRGANQFVVSDLRKFTEQHGDVIRWDQSNHA